MVVMVVRVTYHLTVYDTKLLTDARVTNVHQMTSLVNDVNGCKIIKVRRNDKCGSCQEDAVNSIKNSQHNISSAIGTVRENGCSSDDCSFVRAEKILYCDGDDDDDQASYPTGLASDRRTAACDHNDGGDDDGVDDEYAEGKEEDEEVELSLCTLNPHLSTWQHYLRRAPPAIPHNVVACLRLGSPQLSPNRPKKNKYCTEEVSSKSTALTDQITNRFSRGGKKNDNTPGFEKAETEAGLDGSVAEKTDKGAEPTPKTAHPASPVALVTEARQPQVYFCTVRPVRPATELLLRFSRSYREFFTSSHRQLDVSPERTTKNHGE
ncbi:hypothetical protein ElyMa_004479400 [Elysia marginata]|uniref:Uncharacterized protein n=1 Tax=Elysia marginata TaxID=1093978 RepID=A0AAV4HH89_9GAST|nr:hypothetical protein ElyMa_004479400 [Elysia marginata]